MEEIYGDKRDVECNEDVAVWTQRKVYRVETFIIPGRVGGNKNKIFRSTEKLDLDSEGDEEKENLDTSVNPEAQKFKGNHSVDKTVTEDKKSICDFDKGSRVEGDKSDTRQGMERILRFDRSLNFLQGMERSQSYDFLPTPKPGFDLKAIRESCEVSYGSCEELCHHGNKNGCTVAAQSPSQVSEEIFKENWMQRLEFLRKRVSLIRDKEVALQERERLLMKKEKELRILERLVREKIQRADLYLKRCTIRNSVNLEDDLPPNLYVYDLSRPSPPPYPEKPPCRVNIEENRQDPTDSRETLSAGSRISDRSKESGSHSVRSGSSRGEKDPKQARETESRALSSDSLKSFPPGKTVIPKINPSLNGPKNVDIAGPIERPKDFQRSKWSAYSSWRCRSKPKLSYDDLDSTLSADIGDSSFAVTSKKLDPRLVRKPRGFARSASERGPKNRPCSLDLDVDLGPDGERVLRKISENMSAISESRGTRFQDYGSIDNRHHKSEPRIDHLIREKKPGQSFENKSNGYKVPDQAVSAVGKDLHSKSRKEKTSFWNEEASDWLRKKRQAYNLATKRIANRDWENKENFENSKSVNQMTEKNSRSKNEKGKKFTIFR